MLRINVLLPPHCFSLRCPHKGTIRREVKLVDPGSCLQAMKDINETSMYRFSPRYPHDGTGKAIIIIQGRVHHTSIVAASRLGDEDLHTSFDALQYCLNQLEAQIMERIPHGDVPFLGTAESIRHELFLQQCLASPTLLYAILIIKAPTHHAASMGCKCIRG